MTDALDQYTKLSPWKPEALAGFRIGDLVDVASLGRCRITALIPPSLVEVQTEHGGRCKCGWRVLSKVKGDRHER
jgi:DNA-directed RNA polymerase subunit RPC12/RpoP